MAHEEMRAVIEVCAAQFSAHLIDLVVRGTHGRTVVEVYIDAEKGVTSELCSDVSREVSEAIDRSGWFRGSYRLDVSSPGIARPLVHPWQYKKHIGRTLDVTVREARGESDRRGRLSSVDDDGIVLEPAKGNVQEKIAFDSIVRAVVRPPW